MTEDRPAPRRVPGHSAWLALLMTAGLLQGCETPQQAAAGSRMRIYVADITGEAKSCTVQKIAPQDGQQTETTMTVGNDGGWCGLYLQMPGPKPYDAGLLTARPAHGDVLVHEVGDNTRIDYTPDRGFAGSDSFAVKLLPGGAVVRFVVTVTPPGSAPPKA